MKSYNGKNSADKAGLISIISLALVLGGIIFVCISTFSGDNDSIWFKLAVVGWVIVYVVLNDWVEPYYSKAFNDMTKVQGKYYIAYFMIDVISFIFLTLFVVNAGEFKEPLHYLCVAAFVVLIVPKNICYRQSMDKKKRKKKYDVINNIQKEYINKTAFEEPKLTRDRFVTLEPEEYVGGKSVDEQGTIKR